MTNSLKLLGLTLTGALLMSACATVDEKDAAMTESKAVATDTASETKTEEAKTADSKVNKDGKICKRTQVVGSKFHKKICGTPEDWERMQREAQDATGEMQRKKSTGTTF